MELARALRVRRRTPLQRRAHFGRLGPYRGYQNSYGTMPFVNHDGGNYPALLASSIANWFTKLPAGGSPRLHDPSDSPGRLIHR